VEGQGSGKIQTDAVEEVGLAGVAPMLRKFEELGVNIDGVGYGFFFGEAEFDRTGEVVRITIDPPKPAARL
jgi:hypothetical protein